MSGPDRLDTRWDSNPETGGLGFESLTALVDRLSEDVDSLDHSVDASSSILCQGLDSLGEKLDRLTEVSDTSVVGRRSAPGLVCGLVGVSLGVAVTHVGYLSVVVWKLNRKAGA